MSPDPTRVRLELDERRARGVHAAIREALNAKLLSGEHLTAAEDVLEQLNSRVPGWLQAGPIGGEAGYLVAAEAVLRALVDAEDGTPVRSSLTEAELLRALRDAKPLGVTADDVLLRMKREKMLTIATHHDTRWFTAAPAGRRFLHRDTAVNDDSQVVRDYNALLDLIYAEHRPTERGHRPSIQAIGRLADPELVELADALIGFDLLEATDVPVTEATWLQLSSKGYALAHERWEQSAPPGTPRRYPFNYPPAPPLPFQRRLPLRIDRNDRVHPTDGDRYCSSYGAPASWLQRSSKTKLFATLKRDGAVQWTCSSCGATWIVYLQAITAAGAPAYADPAAGIYNRPMWRPASRYD